MWIRKTTTSRTIDMPRFYLIFGILALSLFSYGQYRGVGLFDDALGKQAQRLSQAARSASHK